MHNGSTCRRAVTLPELMVVIGIIAIILAILLPALGTVRGQAQMSSSQNNMRQIAIWMRAYERDHRETMLPSQFDYSRDIYVNKGNVRSGDVATGEQHRGTWADILWTINNLGPITNPIQGAGTVVYDYRYDAPDRFLYTNQRTYRANPFRAAANNRRDFVLPTGASGSGVAKPHGDGAHEAGYPGFFAANDFFDSRPPAGPAGQPGAPPYLGDDAPEIGRWWSTGQIRAPERSMFLVDSFAGEVIAPVDDPYPPFDNSSPDTSMGFFHRTIEVDFRYAGNCLMLMLDGSIRPEGPWTTLDDLEEQRGIRVRQLDRRVLVPQP